MPSLTPTEVIRIGIEAGQPADVIVASLEAAGFKIVPERRELSADQQRTPYNSPSKEA